MSRLCLKVCCIASVEEARLTVVLRLPVLLLLAAMVPAASAQPEPAPPPMRAYAFVIGLSGGGGFPLGAFREEVGGHHYGGVGFAGVQGQRFGAGIELASYTLDRQTTTAEVGGLGVDVTTSTSLGRLGLFGRYAFLGSLDTVLPYVEAAVGVNLLTTDASVDGSGSTEGGQELVRDAALAAGGGMGIVFMPDPEGFPVLVNVQIRYMRGGEAEYQIYEDERERFTTRSSSTSMVSLSVGMMLGF